MNIVCFKPSLKLLIFSLLIIVFLMPDLSYAYNGGHLGYSNYGHSKSHHYGYSRRYGYRNYGHSRHYGYQEYRNHRYYPSRSYRRNRYNYPSSRYRQYRGPYTLTVPSSIKVYGESNTQQTPNTEYSGINSSAWQTLAQGKYSAALNTFAREAQSHPNSGVPKAGYALAIASSGNLKKGVWALRRAFRIDPDSLHYLNLDEKNHSLIDHLIGQYSAQRSDSDVDQAFMESALNYLKHDYPSAKKSIANARQYGDDSPSLTNLQRLIDEQSIDQEK